jgi:hypothetical protein
MYTGCLAHVEVVEWVSNGEITHIYLGTLGICTSQLLLFIALAVNKEGKGVPLALFLFSAPMGN